jgi:hydrogenase expression/formation protein HypC
MCLAVPGKILSIESDDPIMRTGRVDFNGVVRDVNLAYVPEAKEGNYVIVHAGFALNIVDETEAREILEHLDEMFTLGDSEIEK